MKHLSSVFLIPVFILSSFFSGSQTNFYKRYPSENTLLFPRLEKTQDNGWIVCEGTPGASKLIKYDQCGNIEWAKTLGGFGAGEMNLCRNGNILLSSSFYSDPTLVKLDSYGNVISTYIYSCDAVRYFVYSAGEFSNGDLFISGIAEMQTNGPYSYFIIKTDSTGNIKWNKGFDNPCCWGFGTACNDGGVLARSGSIAYKTDSLGNMEWTKIYTSYSFKPIELNDGFLFAKYSESSALDTCFLYKIDKQGNILWTSESFYANDLTKIVRLPSGNLITIGSQRTTPSAYHHIPTLIELDSTGNFLSQVVCKPPVFSANSFVGRDFCVLDDGTIPFIGSELFIANNSNASNLYLGKAGKKFKLNCGDSVVTSYYSRRNITVNNYPLTTANLPFAMTQATYTTINYNLNEVPVCSGYDSLKFNFQPVHCISSGNMLTLAGPPGKTYLWSNGAITQSLQVSMPGQYMLNITDPCSHETVIVSWFVKNCSDVSLDETRDEDLFNLYPNPTNGKIIIHDRHCSAVRVTNLVGNEILNMRRPDSPEFEIDFGKYPKGIYFVHAKQETGVIIRKVILE